MEDLKTLNKTELQHFLNIYEEQLKHFAQRMLQEEVIKDKALMKHFITQVKMTEIRIQQCKDLL